MADNIQTSEEKEILTAEEISPEQKVILQQMMEAGLMYGHKKSKTQPKFKPYIYGTRNDVEIIDLGQTLPAIDEAIRVLKEKIKQGGLILVVAIQPAVKEAVESLAKKFNFCCINERWIGGLLTNFKIISQRIEYFKKNQAAFEKGEFEKYTKKERVMINRDISRMKKMFSGLENLSHLPDLIFMIDPSLKGHKTAIHEAKKMKIPVMAILDSDDNPESVDYVIPANDHAKSSIDWIINRIDQGLETNTQ